MLVIRYLITYVKYQNQIFKKDHWTLNHQNSKERFSLLILKNQFFKKHIIKKQPQEKEFKIAIF